MLRRSSAWISLVALAAFVAPHLGQLADNLHNAHAYCAAHDDFVHGADREEAAAHNDEALALRAPHKRLEQTHSHCESWKTGLRPAETIEACPAAAARKASPRAHTRPERKPLPAQIPIMALAPKADPPRV